MSWSSTGYPSIAAWARLHAGEDLTPAIARVDAAAKLDINGTPTQRIPVKELAESGPEGA